MLLDSRSLKGRHMSDARVHPDSELTSDQAEELRRVLLERRRSLLEKHAEHLDIGRYGDEPIAEAEEAAARDAARSTMIDLAESQRRQLAQIERALEKLENGTYGVSEDSGEPIGFDRLRVIPWAALNTRDQEVHERAARERGW
jgi:DnaK suppressor protein